MEGISVSRGYEDAEDWDPGGGKVSAATAIPGRGMESSVDSLAVGTVGSASDSGPKSRWPDRAWFRFWRTLQVLKDSPGHSSHLGGQGLAAPRGCSNSLKWSTCLFHTCTLWFRLNQVGQVQFPPVHCFFNGQCVLVLIY